ncbi:MAG TPA: Ppx/GppA phosphatase family protein [Myxococcota bacterium]|nr:Ppx/GppA phosphatase family protein [Myxococcota bacterium]HRY92890.1 Ppx/GppA phosphatase family protein [Myxococcota bacterium]HSA21516.1 Ppx/GppA phosphatase family protein [Myxococcota bacterium]
MDPCAALDVGTNSVLMLVARRTADGRLERLLDLSRVTRLGQGLLAEGRIGAPGAERTLAALREFASRARALGVTRAAAVGTMCLRTATNAAEFIARARAEAGFELEAIPGEEEARLTFLGVTAELPVRAGRLAVVDPGGGSTEVTFGQGGDVPRVDWRSSLEVGVVTLTERFLRSDPIAPAELAALRAFLADEGLAAVRPELPFEALLAVGGSATTLAAVELGLEPYDPDRVHGQRLGRDDLERLLARLSALPVAERARVPGLEPKRAEVLPAGAAILLCLLDKLGAGSLVVSDRGLRHGLWLERFGRSP